MADNINIEEYIVENDRIVYDEMEFEDDAFDKEYFTSDIESINTTQEVYPMELEKNSSKQSISKTVSGITTGIRMHINQVYQTEQLTAYVTDSSGNRLNLYNQPLKFTINGVNYLRYTDSYGLASLTLNLNPGTYTVYISFNGNGNYDPFSGYATVYVIQRNTILTALSNTVNQGDGFKIKVTDGTHVPIANKNVKITINGVTYDRTTDNYAIANLNINLNPNNYIVNVAFNSQPGYKAASAVSKTITVISNNNLVQSVLTLLTSVMNVGGQFQVKLTNGDEAALSGKTVNILVNGVNYNKVTDSNGVASLAINLASNTYKVVVNFGGDNTYKSTTRYKLIHTANSKTDNAYINDFPLSTYSSISNQFCDYSSAYIRSLSSTLTASSTDDLEKSISIHNYVTRMSYSLYSGPLYSALNSLTSYKLC
ncbi:MAG: hypothetical protein KO202_04165 [Methanobacteriaceae archaeon]|jgi:hypothetical protein|nr:hypothetical protein [Methanobacteriaceae archaeon]